MTTTIEKLFAQILDRKCHIINQAKQQADSYSQHLASKLLIDGITPPPWLWNPSFAATSSSDLKEFKKEQLLSELLLPHPRPIVTNRGGFCSLYNPPVVLEGKEEVEARGFVITHVSNENFDLEHGSAFVLKVNGNETGSALNAPEQDVSATSLQGQIEVSTSDIISEPANKKPLKGSSFESFVTNAEYKSIPLPKCNYNDVGCSFTLAPELDQSIISPQGKNETRISTDIAAYDQSLSRLQRSKSRQKALELRKTIEKAVTTHQAESNVSAICYNQEEIFSNASNQQQPEDGALLAPKSQATGECLNKEKDADLYSGRITRSRNTCNLLVDDSKSRLERSLDVAEVDCRTIRSHNSSIEGITERIHLSNASSQRVARSKSGPSEKFPLNNLSSHENCHTQKAPSSEFIPCSPDKDDITELKAKTDGLIGNEVILVGSVEPQAACSKSKLYGTGSRAGSQGFDLRLFSQSGMVVKPKTLDFDKMGKICLITENSPMVEKENLDKSLENTCEPAGLPASLGKVTCSNCLRKSMEKQSVGKEISSQITESGMDINESCLDKRVIDDEHVSESRMSKNVGDISDIDRKIRSSHVLHEEQTRPPNAYGDIDTLMYPEEEEIYLPNQQVQKCEFGCNQMIRGDATPVSSFINNSNACQSTSSRRPVVNEGNSFTLDSTRHHVKENQNMMNLESGVDGGLTSSGSVLLKEKLSVRDDGLVACAAVDSLPFGAKFFTPDEIRQLKYLEESSMQGGKLLSTVENTWPQCKRRKIEHFGGNSINRNLNNMGPNLRASLQFECIPSSHKENAAQSDLSKSPDVELQPNLLTQDTGLLPEMPIEQDGACISFVTSSLSSGCAKEYKIRFGLKARTGVTTNTFLDESMQGSERDYKDLVHFENDIPIQNKDELNSYRTLLETKPYVVEEGIYLSFPVGSPQDKHLATRASDQTAPEFESFTIGGEDSRQRHVVDDSFDHMNLPTTSVERASLLEQLCKSAVKHTPQYQFSATKKFHRTPDVYQSASNALLELLDLNITSNFNSGDFQQMGTSDRSVDELEGASQGIYTDGIPLSGTETSYAQSVNLPISPVSKLWGRISSQSFSSEKLGSNPELTCFPIEEDPSISDEQQEEEVATSSEEDVCSASMDCGEKRDPLTDITQANLDHVEIEINFSEAHGGVKPKLGKRPSSKRIDANETKKKLTLSTSENCTGLAKKSLKNRLSEMNLSRKTSLRKGGKSVAGREAKHNNIVSNISSFVPLVQQKQAAAVIIGKRDVKVKALEAAEAAKRLEEKKENERKLKKEALKLEKARLEEEKLRQAEVKRKKKEDEVKKKEADAATRKRLREEEEKKEKERKRRRFEGKRQQQREQEEKLWARKLEKEFPVGAMDARLNNETVILDALRKPQKVKVDENKGDGNNVKKSDTEFMASKSLKIDVRQAVLECIGHSRVSAEVTNTTRGKSYEISPYQSSDDDDDEISPRKFVPTWASKKSLALIVSSQHNVDPDSLFSLESFCSVDEISGHGVYKKK